jgi:hypothetical protein
MPAGMSTRSTPWARSNAKTPATWATANPTPLRVPFGGYMFSSLELNHSYHDTDVMISLAKLKRHITAGVTLSMKNLFGITPNALYGDEAGSEKAIEAAGRCTTRGL